jgi:hypothetical protein
LPRSSSMTLTGHEEACQASWSRRGS